MKMPRKKVEEKEEKRRTKTSKIVKTEEKKAEKKLTKSEKEKKLEELKEKAKKIAKKISGGEEKLENIKEKVKEGAKFKKETLVPLDDYVKSGIYIGTKVITPHMRPYVYRRRADGIAILNTNLIDENLKKAVKFLVGYNPEDFIVVCKREAGWRAVKLFSELTGVKVFTKKYPAGIITNTQLPDFFETDLIVICDPWLDKNALKDARKTKKKVLGLCDTNNYTFDVDVVTPCNNKAAKSLGVVFYILSREYMKAKGIKKKLPELEEFTGEKLE